jgi:aromatic-L-amino-acid decarboxylase
MLPELRHHFRGWERADSVVFNPHKWMFVPQGCTALLVRRMERIRRALSVVPHYLETPEGKGGAREYMDYGIQLGRPFRALKLWLTFRLFGAEGMRERLKEHLALAREFRAALERLPEVELVAPTHFSLVVFRYAPKDLAPEEADGANRAILEAVNADGRCFISHAVVDGRTVLRVAIGNLRTKRRHLATFLEVFQKAVRRARSGPPA